MDSLVIKLTSLTNNGFYSTDKLKIQKLDKDKLLELQPLLTGDDYPIGMLNYICRWGIISEAGLKWDELLVNHRLPLVLTIISLNQNIKLNLKHDCGHKYISDWDQFKLKPKPKLHPELITNFNFVSDYKIIAVPNSFYYIRPHTIAREKEIIQLGQKLLTSAQDLKILTAIRQLLYTYSYLTDDQGQWLIQEKDINIDTLPDFLNSEQLKIINDTVAKVNTTNTEELLTLIEVCPHCQKIWLLNLNEETSIQHLLNQIIVNVKL